VVVGLVFASSALSAFASGGPESATDPGGTAERLGSLAAQALPMGEIFQRFIDTNPTWPAMKNADKIEPKQLECMRSQLSIEGVRKMKIEEARSFVAARPELASDAVRVLEQGGAAFLRASVNAGAEAQAKGGTKPDMSALMSQFSAWQLSAAIDLVGNVKYAPVREFIGIGDAIQLSGESPGARNQGASAAAKLMLRAVQQCQIPMSAFQ
jgi:hypothetical protein